MKGYGISTSPLKLAGIDGNNAALCTGSSSWSALPSLSTNVGSGAYGISADAVYVAGFSPLTNGVKRPVVWVNGSPPIDLAANLGATRAGTNYAVNASGVSVGQVQYTVAGTTVWRGFRTTGGTNALATTGDDLPPPGSDTEFNPDPTAPTFARGLNGSAIAVGHYTDLDLAKDFGAVWVQRTGISTNPSAINLKRWRAPVPGGAVDASCQVFGINDSGWAVGYSKAGSGQKRAVLMQYAANSGAAWRDLNDKHFVSGLTGWNLTDANAINTAGVVVGLGTLNGSPRGFILVPRIPGN